MKIFGLVLAVLIALLAVGGFIAVQYGGFLFSGYLAFATTVISIVIFAAFMIINYVSPPTEQLPFKALLPLVLIVLLIIIFNLFLSQPIYRVPNGTITNNSNVNNGGTNK
jgi:hypothetical protein